MRRSACSVVVVAIAAFAPGVRAAPSNPAFLGIEMLPTPRPGCLIRAVTADSAAAAAGLQPRDTILALDGIATADCPQLTAQIISHQPGDDVRIDVERGAQRVVLHATLLTRAEVLNRKFVGRAFESLEVTDADDESKQDLSELRGATRILAWFDPRCTDCEVVVRHIASTLEKRRGQTGATKLLGVTFGEPDAIKTSKLALRLGVPVEVVPEDRSALALTPLHQAMSESDRVYIMVFDCRGIVRFVTPIVPEGDDVDGAIDEVLAAAEHAEHARLRHG